MDLLIMVFFASRLRTACTNAGVPVGFRLAKMWMFWLVAEFLVMGICLEWELDLLTTSFFSAAGGIFVGFLAYRQILDDLRNRQEKDQENG